MEAQRRHREVREGKVKPGSDEVSLKCPCPFKPRISSSQRGLVFVKYSWSVYSIVRRLAAACWRSLTDLRKLGQCATPDKPSTKGDMHDGAEQR